MKSRVKSGSVDVSRAVCGCGGVVLLPDWFFAAEERILDLCAHDAVDDVAGVETTNSAAQADGINQEWFHVAGGGRATQVAECKLVQGVEWVGLEPELVVVGVLVHQREHENGDHGKHPHERFHDVKVVVDTKTEQQEWVFLDLSVTFWEFYLHLAQNGSSQVEGKVFVFLVLASASFETRQNVVRLYDVSKWMKVF